MPGHWLACVRFKLTPIERVLECPEDGCRWRCSARRHGVAGGALASSARLRGELAQHLRSAHPNAYAERDGR